jgi:hypothetical protein
MEKDSRVEVKAYNNKTAANIAFAKYRAGRINAEHQNIIKLYSFS